MQSFWRQCGRWDRQLRSKIFAASSSLQPIIFLKIRISYINLDLKIGNSRHVSNATLTSGMRSTQSWSKSPGINFTLTGPLALTVAHLAAAVVKLLISPTNWPSLLTATKYSLGPLASVEVNILALLAPCTHLDIWDSNKENWVGISKEKKKLPSDGRQIGHIAFVLLLAMHSCISGRDSLMKTSLLKFDIDWCQQFWGPSTFRMWCRDEISGKLNLLTFVKGRPSMCSLWFFHLSSRNSLAQRNQKLKIQVILAVTESSFNLNSMLYFKFVVS